jgi:hypothetical protein
MESKLHMDGNERSGDVVVVVVEVFNGNYFVCPLYVHKSFCFLAPMKLVNGS